MTHTGTQHLIKDQKMCRRNEFPLNPLMHPDSPLSVTVDKHPLAYQILFLLQAQSLHSPIRKPPWPHPASSDSPDHLLSVLTLFPAHMKDQRTSARAGHPGLASLPPRSTSQCCQLGQCGVGSGTLSGDSGDLDSSPGCSGTGQFLCPPRASWKLPQITPHTQ